MSRSPIMAHVAFSRRMTAMSQDNRPAPKAARKSMGPSSTGLTAEEARKLVAAARACAPWIEPEVADRFTAAGYSREQASAQLFTMVTDVDAGADLAARLVIEAFRGERLA